MGGWLGPGVKVSQINSDRPKASGMVPTVILLLVLHAALQHIRMFV